MNLEKELRKNEQTDKMPDIERTYSEALLLSLESLSQINQESLQKIAKFTLKEAIHLTKSELGYFTLLNEDGPAVTNYAWSDNVLNKCIINNKTFISSDEANVPWEKPFHLGEPIIINDYNPLDFSKKIRPGYSVGIFRQMDLPVFDREKIVAVIGVANKKEPYDVLDIKTLSLFMKVIWNFFKGRMAENDLKKSEERCKTIIDTITDYIYTVYIKDGYPVATVHSSNCFIITGYTAEEFRINPYLWINMVYERDRILVKEYANKIISGMSAHPVEHRIIRKDGAIRWVRNTPVLYYDRYGRLLSYEGLIKDITEKKIAQEALRESEERYRLLFNQMQTGFALHEIVCNDAGIPIDYIFLDINPAFENLTGLKKEEIINNSVHKVLSAMESYFIEIYGQVALTGRHVYFEYYSKEFDKFFEVNAFSPKIGQFATILTDITLKRKAENALAESEERFRSIIENTEAGYFFIDRNGIYRDVNKAWLNMHGYDSFDEVIGKHFSFSQVGIDREEAQKIVDKLFRREPISGREFARYCKDGSTGYHSFSINSVVHKNKVIGLEGFLIDITDRVIAEKELKNYRDHLEDIIRQRTNELMKTQDSLIRAERFAATGQLAASIAHEINSPLQAITVLLNTIKNKRKEDNELLEDIDLLKGAFNNIRDTVKKLLDLNRPGKEKKQPVNVNVIIENTVSLLSSYLKSKKVKIDLELSSDISNIIASPQQLGQVFINLINNSVEAMTDNLKPEEIQKLNTPKEQKILIKTGIDKGNIIIEFSDTGPGIPERDMIHIFDPFYTGKKKMGMGIGLSICHGIIEEHKGSINVRNLSTGGAIFIIILPYL